MLAFSWNYIKIMVLSEPWYQGGSVEAPRRQSEMVKSKIKRKSETHFGKTRGLVVEWKEKDCLNGIKNNG